MNQSQVISFPNKPEDRLRTALRELEEALSDQALAFQAFRLNMAVLGTAVGGLERSLESYRGLSMPSRWTRRRRISPPWRPSSAPTR